MRNSSNPEFANNSNSFDLKQPNSGNVSFWGCLAMIVVYALIIWGLFRLWSGIPVSSVFDGWQPTYP